MGEAGDYPEWVVVDPWMDDMEVIRVSEFNPESMHRAWSSWEREKRAHPQHYRGSLRHPYPVLPGELIARLNAAESAYVAVIEEVDAAIRAASRKSLDDFAKELGWTPDDA